MFTGDPEEEVRVGLRHVFDLDPALGTGDHQGLPGREVDRHGEVDLVGDRHLLLDQEELHGLTLYRQAEEALRLRTGLGGIVREPDPADLAPTLHTELGFEGDGAPEPSRRHHGVVRGRHDLAARDPDPVRGEDLFRLVFAEVHGSFIPACSNRREVGTRLRLEMIARRQVPCQGKSGG